MSMETDIGRSAATCVDRAPIISRRTQGKSWGIGFAIPAVAMLLAVIIFVAGNGRYKHEKPTGSPLERVADITWHACGHSLRNLLCCGAKPQEVHTPRTSNVRITPPPALSRRQVHARHSFQPEDLRLY